MTASFESGVALLFTVRLTVTEPYTTEITARLPKSVLRAFAMAERKSK